MKNMFQKTLVELVQKETHQSLLYAIGGGWYMNKSNQDLPPLKKRRHIKKSQGKEDEIKRKLHKANRDCND